jgi:hypothetical protein
MLEGSGVIVYDPPRGTLKRRTEWWCVVNVSEDIGCYYRWWVRRALHLDLHRSPHRAHISVIRGECPSDDLKHLWGRHQGRRIAFQYSPNVRRSGDTTGDRPNFYWFVEIECPELSVIRQEFGFPCKWRYHLTIGRTYP